MSERRGLLWDAHARFRALGFALDTTSYATCFRAAPGSSTADALAKALAALPEGLTSTFNLGQADVYPSTSGKEAAGRYLVERFGGSVAEAAFLCDDDNDVALALALGRAYLPSVSSVRLGHAIHIARDSATLALRHVL